jgi:hypothetical protein
MAIGDDLEKIAIDERMVEAARRMGLPTSTPR